MFPMLAVNARIVPSNQVSGECWMVQFHGLGYCKGCAFTTDVVDLMRINRLSFEKVNRKVRLNSKRCGGLEIRKTGRNSLGFQVPLGKDLEVKTPDTG